MANVLGKFYSGVKLRRGVTPESPTELIGVQPYPLNPPGSGNFVTIDTDQTITGEKTFTTQVSVTGSYLSLSALPDNRSKLRIFGTSPEWGIGTQSASTFGRLNNTAVTFNVPNTDTQGWLWGDSGHTLPSQGSMSLTSNGNLTIANSLRIGYGEGDVDDAVSYKLDHNGTVRLAGIPSGTIVDTLGLDADNQVVKGAGGGGITQVTSNWTPTLIDAGGGATYSFTANNRTFYVKTGRMVYVSIGITGITTSGTPTGQLQITGLPFEPSNNNFTITKVGYILGSNLTAPESEKVVILALPNSSTLLFREDNNVSTNDLEAVVFSPGSIYVSFSYITN